MERVPTLKSELEAKVKKYPNSLIATNACIGGEVGGLVLALIEAEKNNNIALQNELKQKINDFILWCKSLFGDDFYFEIAPGSSKDQRAFNNRVKSIAKAYNLKMICATDAHYYTAADREIHKGFLNSKDGDREVDSFYHDAHLMTDNEAYDKLKDFYSQEEFQQMCNNSLEIMNKIENYDIFHDPIIPEVSLSCAPPREIEELKDYPILYSLCDSDNIQERKWVFECLKSMQEKNLLTETYYARLELEADVIKHISNKLNNCLFAYFNTFQHYIDLFWECGAVVGPGRGSAGSFLSNYLLGITQLDPVTWNLPYFRFLNKERAELPDIDIDLPPSKRPRILQKIRQERGELNVVQVATFGTESAKAAIACACRGYRNKENPNGIDVDIATYMSSLVPIERGISWTLTECIKGNEEKDRKPVKQLVQEFNIYPGLLDIAFGVEGLICRRGQHASGLNLYNRTPYDTTALMRSPNGDITTQFDLHRGEKLGDVKFDFLVTDICDKLSVALDLLSNDGYFSECKTKREIYDKYLHPSKINLEDTRLWNALATGNVQDVFQFNTAIGIQTARAIQPRNPAQMTAANALLRLVAPEGQERPFDRYVRFKNDISLWYKEMDEAGLTKEEEKTLEPYYLRDFGVPASQEQLMLLTMDKDISHFTLAEANATRKVLAKKIVKEIPVIQEKFLSQCPSKALGEYAWKTMMLPQMSYSFSEVHALLYSFIGIQTLVIATNYPSIYWNTACLIVNSQSIPEEEESEVEEIYDKETCVEENEDEVELEDDDADDADEEETETKKKKKIKTPYYGRIATAIGKIRVQNIEVAPPDVNYSTFTFSPDKDKNVIRYGLSGITRIGEDLVKQIMANRPYSDLSDFLSKNKLTKPQVVNLIKSGAFDSICEDRVTVMSEYVDSIADKKKRITLQNMQMLINHNLIPHEFEFEIKVYNFNKYLKKYCKDGTNFKLIDYPLEFYQSHFDTDLLSYSSDGATAIIGQKTWDNIYQKYMDNIRPYIKKNNETLLDTLNEQLVQEVWDKYCKGSISKWEMDSVSFYSHEHELAKLKDRYYGIVDFQSLGPEPEIERVFTTREGKTIPMFKLVKIAGTVLDKNKQKKTVELLTKSGVVTVKVYGVFSEYDRQISMKDPTTGKKKVIEKSMFSRGNKLIITGIRQDDSFIAKMYKNTPGHRIVQILDVNDDGTAVIKEERMEVPT